MLPTRAADPPLGAAALEHAGRDHLRIVERRGGAGAQPDYRGKDYATNVLTFVYGETAPGV